MNVADMGLGASEVVRGAPRSRHTDPANNQRNPKMKKPRQDEPTGVDGGQIALAIGFGEKSWMSSSPRCKRLHLEVAGYRSASLEREPLNQRCESFRNAIGDYAGMHQESSLGTSFHDEDLQSHIGNGYKTPVSGFLPRKWQLLGDRRQKDRHAGASPAVAGLSARKLG
jgi:hypothetical protein